MDTRTAARRWARTWAEAWPRQDIAAIVALQAADGVHWASLFRRYDGRDGLREYLEECFAEEVAPAETWFAEPWVDDLEADCDRYLERVEPLRSFILPGGSPGAAYLHVATTIVRRAERSAWAAIAAHGDQPGTEKGVGGVNRLTATYLNRLSDLLFILARVANVERGGDVLWQPGGGRVEKPERTRRT